MKPFSKPFESRHAKIRRPRADGLRQWFPVVILLTLLTTGMGVMAESSTVGQTVGENGLPPTGSCCHQSKPLAAGSEAGCLHAPLDAVGEFSIDRWSLPLSAETDMPDMDPVTVKTRKSLAFFIPEAAPTLRPISERQQTFTPLYIAHQSLIC